VKKVNRGKVKKVNSLKKIKESVENEEGKVLGDVVLSLSPLFIQVINARREWNRVFTASYRNFHIKGRKLYLGENADISIERAVCEKCSATWNIGKTSAFVLGYGKQRKKVKHKLHINDI
jgi:hypothetical protein